jgi:FKBP-type peptidyl-prolyl cis-trans isomerase
MVSKRMMLCAAAAMSLGVGVLVADDKPAEKTAAKPAATQPTVGKPVTTASGLKITVTEESRNPGAQKGDIVWVNYTGKLSTGEQFDTSVGREPFKFVLGEGKVIKGWDEGVVGMKVGEKRQLVIPPELGYGAAGAGAKIPGNSTLVFDIEMIGLARPGQ